MALTMLARKVRPGVVSWYAHVVYGKIGPFSLVSSSVEIRYSPNALTTSDRGSCPAFRAKDDQQGDCKGISEDSHCTSSDGGVRSPVVTWVLAKRPTSMME